MTLKTINSFYYIKIVLLILKRPKKKEINTSKIIIKTPIHKSTKLLEITNKYDQELIIRNDIKIRYNLPELIPKGISYIDYVDSFSDFLSYTVDLLFLCGRKGLIDIIRYIDSLNNCNFDIKYGNYIIRTSLQFGYIDNLKYFVENHRDYVVTLIQENCLNIVIICACGQLDMLKYFIKLLGEFNIQIKESELNNAVDSACENGHLDVIEYLFDTFKLDSTILLMRMFPRKLVNQNKIDRELLGKIMRKLI